MEQYWSVFKSNFVQNLLRYSCQFRPKMEFSSRTSKTIYFKRAVRNICGGILKTFSCLISSLHPLTLFLRKQLSYYLLKRIFLLFTFLMVKERSRLICRQRSENMIFFSIVLHWNLKILPSKQDRRKPLKNWHPVASRCSLLGK